MVLIKVLYIYTTCFHTHTIAMIEIQEMQVTIHSTYQWSIAKNLENPIVTKPPKTGMPFLLK